MCLLLFVCVCFTPAAHPTLIAMAWSDFIVWSVAHSVPLAVHWGDMSFACANLDRVLAVLRGPVLKQEQLTQDLVGLVAHGSYYAAMFAHHCNLSTEHRVRVAAFMNDFNFSWHSVDATMDAAAESWSGVRKRGDSSKDTGAICSVEMVCWLAKCGWYLCATEPGVSAAEVAAALPSIEEIIDMNPWVHMNICHNYDGCNLLVNMSCVWEKIGRHEDALRYATAALENDVAHSGTVNPSVRTLAHMVQGRAHAALGRAQAAADAFEAAVELADKYGLWLYQALALKDLKLCVLDRLGHGEHGSRRLGAALRLLVGPAEMLTPVMDGLDAAELIALSPPSRVHITYSCGEDVSLRADLSALKLKALKRRAREDGISAELLEDVDDADDVRGAVIQLILDAARDAAIDCKTAPEPEPEPEPEPGGTMLHCNALPEGTPPPKRHAGYVRKDSGSR